MVDTNPGDWGMMRREGERDQKCVIQRARRDWQDIDQLACHLIKTRADMNKKISFFNIIPRPNILAEVLPVEVHQ